VRAAVRQPHRARGDELLRGSSDRPPTLPSWC
jgi:hypothetical protein